MNILKKENWWVWLLIMFFSSGTGVIVLAALLDCYDKDEWYAQKKYWLIALACLIFPVSIMAMVFVLTMLCRVCAKLNVPGKELYLSPYVWLLFLIIPIIGWIFILVTVLYLNIWHVVALYKGEGEQYIK
ncbi:MAG TPA: hypothetical protein PLV83_03665 [Bacilli bacterium]|nr:hypothetical protein [Bacilli bacterium]